MDNFKNILVFGHSNIGDVCYDMVVVWPLRKNFPNARISFITSDKSREVAEVCDGVDEVIVFDKKKNDKGILGYLRFIFKIRSRKFDLAIILRDTQMQYFFNIPACIKPAKSVVRDYSSHVAQKYLELLEQIGIKNEPPRFNFKFSKANDEFADKMFAQNRPQSHKISVGIMPFAGWLLKCWPIEHWNKLVDFLDVELNAKVFVFGKPDNSEWTRDFLEQVSAKTMVITDKGLAEGLAMIKRLDVFIGPDSSLLHLASCAGVKSIGLYGATNKNFIYPLFHKEYIVQSKSRLDCMPCYPGKNPGSCAEKNRPAKCMLGISAEDVIEKIKQAVGERGK
ncbi:MAG: glycosyltransferase family 9 protein [Candidatus Omnitrophica bacterium]|nr:glycosyltransferase family 9 protein [Candidatus Omnitrophota bacterium]